MFQVSDHRFLFCLPEPLLSLWSHPYQGLLGRGGSLRCDSPVSGILRVTHGGRGFFSSRNVKEIDSLFTSTDNLSVHTLICTLVVSSVKEIGFSPVPLMCPLTPIRVTLTLVGDEGVVGLLYSGPFLINCLRTSLSTYVRKKNFVLSF